MADDHPTGDVASALRCPWCSAPLESGSIATCPACGATLTADAEPQLPGVTTVAPSSIARIGQRRPNRIVQWITGDTGEAAAPPSTPAPGSLTPPAADVRVEMLRIELAARLADRNAEIDALQTEARLEAGPEAMPPNVDDRAAAGPDGAQGAPPTEPARPSTWAELDETRAGEPPSAEERDAPSTSTERQS